MTNTTVRIWYLVHKWTSIVCTAFLFMLCLTGLPLIFHEEIAELTAPAPVVSAAQAGQPASLDAIVRTALKDRPRDVGQYVSFDEEKPVVYVTTAPPDKITDYTFRGYDAHSGRPVGAADNGSGVMAFILRLHTDMFLGLPGLLFLGMMGLLFFTAIVSGVVLYAPFMRKLRFGTLRTTRSRRLKWLDYHNLLGVVALAWASVVGLTGVINTLATPIVQLWQANDLAQMTAAYAGLPAIAHDRLSSVQAAVDTAKAAAPGNRPQFVAFPGTTYSSKHHYAVFLQGATPLTKRLLTPALIDATTGKLTAIAPMPWYVQALLLSQPLHFGDYGGLPMKILWALLDVITIVILGSGIYLWLGKRRSSLDARVREVETGGVAVPVTTA